MVKVIHKKIPNEKKISELFKGFFQQSLIHRLRLVFHRTRSTVMYVIEI